jgi:hypothetical protein
MIVLVKHKKEEMFKLDDNDALHPNKVCNLDMQTKVKVYQATYVVQPGEFLSSFGIIKNVN